MTFDALKIRVGKNIKYYSDSAGWLTTRDVTETDIGDYINEVYTEELFPLFASRWPHMFRQTTLFDSWIMTTTVAAGTVDQTLVIATSANVAFSNAMEGLLVYNETQDDSALLKTFVDTDEFTVDSSYDLDDWTAGDTIYVLGQEFAFGGDSTDLFTIERIKIKYTSTASYKIARVSNKPDLFVTGQESFSKSFPEVYQTAVQDAGTIYPAIGILPKMDAKVGDAIEVDYIAKPSAMSSATAIPIIPVQESMICGGTMKAYEKKQDMRMATYWMNKYELAKVRDISRYRPMTSNVPVQIKADRNTYYIHRRII